MISKSFKILSSIAIIIAIIWGFSDSYSSHTLDNIVHVVAIGVDKCSDGENTIKVSFQFVNMSSSGEGSSGGEASTIVTSINSTTINKAINLMNSYIGRELNFSHCKVIVFSEDFAKDGISTEICTFINNEEFRPSSNIIISTSEANTYLKNSNPNIEKIVTNYYETLELTSNFTGYSADTTIGQFYKNLINPYYGNTAILGRTFEKVSEPAQSEESSNGGSQDSSGGSSSGDSQSSSGGGSSQDQSSSGESSSSSSSQNNSGGASLEISGERGTQNVGIAVFKDDVYIGQLSEIDSICHLVVTNNVDSFVISVPMEQYPDNLIDLNVSPIKSSKITVDVSSSSPIINISVLCEARILTIDKNANYEDSKVLDEISKNAEEFLKQNMETYLNKTSKEFNSDIAGFFKHATSKFLTIEQWENYNWNEKYQNSQFTVNVNIDVMSSTLFSGN